jgi:hypothetical protein
MIHYDLRCAEGHTFDGWFASSAAFERQREESLLACPVCGSAAVDRALMAPALSKGREPAPAGPERTSGEPANETRDTGQEVIPPAQSGGTILDDRATQVRNAIRALRKAVETHGVDVGRAFPEEARRIHNGETEPRGIYGQAEPDEARALLDEGVPVLPIPTLPDERN